jgi:hypothetical protein
LDLPHGLAAIPKLAFEGQLERGGVGGIIAVCKQTAAVSDIEGLLDIYAESVELYLVDSCAMEPVDVELRDPDKVVWVPPRRLSRREEKLLMKS